MEVSGAIKGCRGCLGALGADRECKGLRGQQEYRGIWAPRGIGASGVLGAIRGIGAIRGCRGVRGALGWQVDWEPDHIGPQSRVPALPLVPPGE